MGDIKNISLYVLSQRQMNKQISVTEIGDPTENVLSFSLNKLREPD